MQRKQKLKIGLLSAFLPTVTTVCLAAVIGVVIKEVGTMGANGMAQKAQNYAALAESAPKNATVFFGDSITELCSVEDIYAEYSRSTGVPVCNRGIGAECTASMLERVDESVIALRPRNLVLLMGVNDLNHGVPMEQIKKNIIDIILAVREKSPETNIVLQAVYPTDPNRDSLCERFQLRGRDNADILELNKKLEAVAGALGVTFVDVTSALADENGNLRKDYTYDGLHPNAQGYLAVRDAIIEKLV